MLLLLLSACSFASPFALHSFPFTYPSPALGRSCLACLNSESGRVLAVLVQTGFSQTIVMKLRAGLSL